MDGRSHAPPKKPWNDLIPLQIPRNNVFHWLQSGAKWILQPSTVATLICLIFLFLFLLPLLVFRANLSLLEISSFFFQGAKKQMEGTRPPGRRTSSATRHVDTEQSGDLEPFRALFARAIERKLPMLCANPDAWRREGRRADGCTPGGKLGHVAVVVKTVLGSHFGVGEFTTHVSWDFSGDWDVHLYGVLTHGHVRIPKT